MDLKNLSKKLIFLLLITASITSTKASFAKEEKTTSKTEVKSETKKEEVKKEDVTKKDTKKEETKKLSYKFNLTILDKNKKEIKENLNFNLLNDANSTLKTINSKDGILILEFEKYGTYYLELANNDKFKMEKLKILVKYKTSDPNSDLEILDSNNKVIESIELLKIENPIIQKKGWFYDDKLNAWFYADENGNKKTGWFYDDDYNGWFYLRPNGKMKTGWFYDDDYNSWFYLRPNGKMKIGWFYDDDYNGWFYLRPNGKMETGWFYDDDYSSWFYLRPNGKMETGWFYDDDYSSWFYLRPNGKMETGWFYDDKLNAWFYLRPNGKMETGWFYDDGYSTWYYFDSNGKWNRSGIAGPNWYTLNGIFQTNWGTRKANVGSNYFVISLSEQKLWLIRSNEIVVKTGIVSGKPSTPTVYGSYRVHTMSRNKTLRGEDYTVWVDYWMDFYNGYGIHDANWQPSYAFNNKNTYRYSGSHGCVNINPSVMPTIYNNSYIGIPVVVTD